MTHRLRPTTLLIAGLATAGLALSACGSDSLTTNPSSTSSSSSTSAAVDPALVAKLPAKIKSAGKIVVGTDATYQPNEYLDTDGKTVIGMDVDLFDAVMAKFGLKTEWQPTGFDSIILGVSSGKYDVGVSSFSVNADRMKQVDDGHLLQRRHAVGRAEGQPEEGRRRQRLRAEDRGAEGHGPGRRPHGTQQEVHRRRQEGDQPSWSTPTRPRSPRSSSPARPTRWLVDLPPAIAAVQLTKGSVELLGDQYDSAPYGFVLPKDQTDFGQAIVDALKSMEKDGSYKQILDKWKAEGGSISDFAVNPSVG